jgi:hypothetical protein
VKTKAKVISDIIEKALQTHFINKTKHVMTE